MEQRLKRFMYDDRLSPNARILLAEISQYYGTPVDCRKDDVYFAAIFKVTVRQVRRWRAELKQLGYIEERYNRFGEKILQYVPSMEEREMLTGDKLVNKIVYFTKENAAVCSTFDAFKYFEAVLAEEGTYLTSSMKTHIKYFCQVFANTLFDERFYGISLGNTRTSQEFFQFIIENFKIETIFTTTQRVASNFEKIQDPKLYILTSVINAFKPQYEMAQKREGYQEHLKAYYERLNEYLAEMNKDKIIKEEN